MLGEIYTPVGTVGIRDKITHAEIWKCVLWKYQIKNDTEIYLKSLNKPQYYHNIVRLWALPNCCKGIHQPNMDSPHKWSAMWRSGVSLLVAWTTLWTNTGVACDLICLWFEMPECSCDITVIFVNLRCFLCYHKIAFLIMRMKTVLAQMKETFGIHHTQQIYSMEDTLAT